MYGDLNRSFQDTYSSVNLEDVSMMSPSNVSMISNNSQKRNKNNKKTQNNQHKQQYKQNLKNNYVPTVMLRSTQNTISMSTNSSHQVSLHQNSQRQHCSADNKPNYFKAKITYVKNPQYFYVQREDALRDLSEMSKRYIKMASQGVNCVPRSIELGICYMAYHAKDKMWYRGLVQKILPADVYKIFLVDVGMHMEVKREALCSLDEKYTSIPYAALRCALYNIVPANMGKVWNEDARNFLLNITNNKSLRISVIELIKEGIATVDIFTKANGDDDEPISVRDSFLYTGLAREKPGGEINFKLQPINMSPVARLNQRLPKHNLSKNCIFSVKVLHVEHPHCFHVIRCDEMQQKSDMWHQLNSEYAHKHANHSLLPIYLATIDMCCVVHLQNNFHRGRVVKIKSEGKIVVRLVDEGSLETVNWNNLHALQQKYREHNEFAIKCQLADVEPLQENSYIWTDKAIAEFQQICSNPVMSMSICASKHMEYTVALYVTKKNYDINVGAFLCSRGLAVCTGENAEMLDICKMPKKRLSLPCLIPPSKAQNEAESNNSVNFGNNCSNPLKSPHKGVTSYNSASIKKTAIKFTHIVSPGEFYIQLASLSSGIAKFHQQLQAAHCNVFNNSSLNGSQLQNKQWYVGEHCMIYTNYKHTHNGMQQAEAATVQGELPTELFSSFEWYRGIIVHITKDPALPYVVFLRDVGITVQSIAHSQLYEIASQWNKVSNAVHRCHLACVEPTGGKNWSQTAIDCFKHTVKSFQQLSATLQGKRTLDTNSLPIVLWGTTAETSDALAPCTSKHSIINRVLVKAGLALLVERLDLAQQLDKIEQEMENGEMPLENWFQNFKDNSILKAIEEHGDNNVHKAGDNMDNFAGM